MIFSKLKQVSRNFKKQLQIFKFVLKDNRTPLTAKLLLGAAIGYLLLPFDLIPDFIPVLGQLDDLIIVPLLIYFALKIVPPYIIEEYNINFNE